MKLNPISKPSGPPTVRSMWVVTVKGVEHVFQDADIASRFYVFNKNKFPKIEEIVCE